MKAIRKETEYYREILSKVDLILNNLAMHH